MRLLNNYLYIILVCDNIYSINTLVLFYGDK